MSAGWMRSKRKSKSKKIDKRGKPATCMHCKKTTHWFATMASGAIWCLDCMEHYGWEHLSATRAATMKDGGANGSPPRGQKQKGNRYLGRWEVSTLATSKSNQGSDDW